MIESPKGYGVGQKNIGRSSRTAQYNKKVNDKEKMKFLYVAPKAIDCVNDDSDDDYYDNVIRSGAWFGALLRSRFEFLGLGGYCHDVLQIGTGYGLLFAVISDVQSVDFESRRL